MGALSEGPRFAPPDFPRMQVDELLLFTQFDSDPLAPCRYCFHTAFEDPTIPANLPPRQSIEVRAIAFFPNYMRDAPVPRPIEMEMDVDMDDVDRERNGGEGRADETHFDITDD